MDASNLPSADLDRYSISANTVGSAPHPPMRGPLLIWLALTNERFEPILQFACIIGRKAMTDFVPSNRFAFIANPIGSVSRWRQVTFTHSLLLPLRILAIPHFRYHAFQARLAGVLKHFRSINFKAFTKLSAGARNKGFWQRLSLKQRELSQVPSIQVQQIERDQHDLGGTAFQFFLQHRKLCSAIIGRFNDFAVDDRRTCRDVPRIRSDFVESASSNHCRAA